MKKRMMICLIGLIISCLLNSCVVYHGRIYPEQSSSYQSLKRMDEISASINNKDESSMIALFSDETQKACPALEKEIHDLFLMIGNSRVTFEVINNGRSSYKDAEYGKIKMSFRYKAIVTAGDAEYLFFLLDYPIDDINPANEGICYLGVAPIESADSLYCPDILDKKPERGVALYRGA